MRKIKWKAHNKHTGEILDFCLTDVFTDKYGMLNCNQITIDRIRGKLEKLSNE